ncbi:DNA-directed RNA polymerase delta subunit [Mesobacillus selenatarsenatis SF-1]|uniref:Probable DNA-directed RNA polymerase subunit delta n=1 Tax=Mesobacillus selenatarsenatis (strain DSM 18680 / JCM 14380 / FERM P-15431 / SF-1) TaxID=1321606 RepID=A0A0A8X0E1_MESS1|nr:DNA-directed RNA polymerase subunit delta [Mesobacillus selenatarsenatis]GAM12719.1 DNA-directed RNA polymerase delta subunit [Mesobacillus selenatarsenatis SF-1]
MSLKQYSKEELQEMSMIEVAFEILKEKKQAVTFQDLMTEIKKVMKLDEAEVTEKMVQFYTDINIDGRFMSQSESRWGLRVWYPVDQMEEDNVTTVKPKKKKAKKAVDEDDLDLDEFDEIDEEDLDFDDDIDEFDEDDDDDLDDDDDDEDFDEDIEDTDDFEDEDELLEDEEEDLPLEDEDAEEDEEQ